MNLPDISRSGPDAFASPQDACVAARLGALSHPARLAIVRRLAAADACCCKDVVRHLDLAQSTVSQHLKVLVQAGLVIYEPTRPRSRYTLNRPVLQEILGAVSGLVDDCCRTGSCQ